MGIVHPFDLGNLTVYPNPAKDRVRIKLENDSMGEISISLSDVTGRKLLDEPHQKLDHVLESTMNLSSIAAGMYILTVQDGGGIRSKKIIVE